MADTIREFVASLGFKIDDAGERRFTQALEGAVVRANLLADAIENMASIAVDKIGAVSTQFEQLYYQSQRIHASEVSIRAFGFAISQVGGHVENANASLQGFGDFLAKTPKAAEAIAHQLNIPLKDTADTGKFLLEIYEKLSHKDRAFADPFREAYHLGDDETFLAGRRKDAQGFYDKEKGREEESGIGPSTSKQAIELQQQWRTFSQSMDDYFIQAETNLSKHVANGFESLNHYIDEHHKKISEFVEWSTNLGFIADVKNSGPVHFDEKKFGEHFQTALGAAETAVVNELHVFEGALGPVVQWLEKWGRVIANFFGLGGSASSNSPTGNPAFTGGGDAESFTKGGGGNSGPHGGSRGIGGWWTPDRMSHAVDRLVKEAGLTREGAAGLVARWSAVEAGGGPTAVNGSSGAAGIGQWLGGRKDADAVSGDFDRNLNHAIKELNTTEKRAGDVLRNAHTGREGARGASMFERAEGYSAASGTDNFTQSTPAEKVLGTLDKLDKLKSEVHPPAPAPSGKTDKYGHPYDRNDPYYKNGADTPNDWEHGPNWDILNHALPTGGSTDNSKSAVVNQHNEIHVTTSDPGAAAAMVGTHLNRTSADIARNTQGAFQ